MVKDVEIIIYFPFARGVVLWISQVTISSIGDTYCQTMKRTVNWNFDNLEYFLSPLNESSFSHDIDGIY